jgi:hypothetical protein
MAAGNFSNGGLDTFDEHKNYLGVRLQQGVPLLDRDWNEMEDIRRHQERLILQEFIGSSGVADWYSFSIHGNVTAPNELRIGHGRYLIDGHLLWNEQDIMFSQQGDRVPLPPTLAGGDELILTLQYRVVRVDATDDPDLANSQDINMETCLRDRIEWSIVAQQFPSGGGQEVLDESYPHGLLVLIKRPPGTTHVSTEMIQDFRTVGRNLFGAYWEITDARRRLKNLEDTFTLLKGDVDSLKFDVGRLFWDVDVTCSSIQALWGEKVTLGWRVVDRHGTPIQGATLALSTDWGTLEPAVVTTGSDGRASSQLVGMVTDKGFTASDVARLSVVAKKVAAATLSNPGSIEYVKIRFEPDEVALVSRYTPKSHLDDLIWDLPDRPIVRPPGVKTATVTAHAKEQASVRGTGSIQVTFGAWVRDWALTKLHEVVSNVQVSSRIGDVMRRGVSGAQFDHAMVAERLPTTLQAISDQTQMTLKQSLFNDPDLPDDDVRGSGFLGQVIAQEATAAIGATAHKAIATQLSQLADVESVQVDAAAHGQLNQKVAQVTAGLTQTAKQTFSVGGRFG